MKTSNILFGLYGVVMLGIASYMVLDHFYIRHIPDLKVGECAVYIAEGNEFEKPRVLEAIKIVKIGKTHYQYLSSNSFNDNDLEASDIWYVDTRYVKVDCNAGRK